MEISDLPTLNATLNAISATLLAAGYVMIKRRNIPAHRALMIAAFVTSGLFLVSYSIYHAQVGSRPFQGEGWVRPVYLAILFSHIVLAAAVLPLAIVTLARALRRRYASHARMARRTFPIWIYVSITGVVVYLMLYA